MIRIKLFTHTDLDGVGCAILIKRAFPHADVELCSNAKIDDSVKDFILSNKVRDFDRIFITDLSVKAEAAELIETRGENKFVLLDHHITADWLNKYSWATVHTEHRKDVKASGTSLVDLYLSDSQYIDIDDWHMGQFTEKVRRYDTWEWAKFEDTHAKQLNDLLYIIGHSKFIKRFVDDICVDFTDGEKLLLEVEDRLIEKYIETKRGEIIRKNHGGIAYGVIFADQYQSIVGNVLANENPDLDIILMIDAGSQKLSYRTAKDDIDVSALAKQRDGGGHPKAAGAPFEISLAALFAESILSTHNEGEVLWKTTTK